MGRIGYLNSKKLFTLAVDEKRFNSEIRVTSKMTPGQKYLLLCLCFIFKSVLMEAQANDVWRDIQVNVREIRRDQNDLLEKYVQILRENFNQQENNRKELASLRSNMINLFTVVEDLRTDLRKQSNEVKDMVEIRKEKYEQTEKILKNIEKYNVKKMSDITNRAENIMKVSEKTLNLLNSGQIKTGGGQTADGNFEAMLAKTITESINVNLVSFKRTSLNDFESIKDSMKEGVDELKEVIYQKGPNCVDHSEEMKIIIEKSFKNLTTVLDNKLTENTKNAIPGNQLPEDVIPPQFFPQVIAPPSTTAEPIPCNRLSFVQEPKNCAELRRDGVTCDGVYTINLNNYGRFAYCDMTTDGGGWTVIARRGDYGEPKTNFDKKWKTYKQHIGSIQKEFWFGNNNLNMITSQEINELRVTLESFTGEILSLTYKEFHVANETSKYILKIGDVMEGGDHPIFGQSLKNHDGHPFSTKDENFSGNENNCAEEFKAGWWYKSDECFDAILTAPYFQEDEFRKDDKVGILWKSWKDWQILKAVEMKVRPANFDPDMP